MALTNTLISASDSTAANQTSQITLETAIRDRIGEISATPTANTLIDRVKTLDRTTSTATANKVTVAQVNISLLAALATRKTFSLYNNGTNTVYVEFGATATLAAFMFPLPAGYLYTDDTDYTGAVSAISAAGNNDVMVRSLS